MRLRIIGAFLRLDSHHLRRDRSSIFWMVVMPFAFMGFFGNVFRGGDPEDRTVSLTVADEDGSEIAHALTALLDTTRFELTDAESLAALAATGGDSMKVFRPIRTLTIPAGLEDSVFAATPTPVTLTRHRGGEDYFFAAEAGIVRALVRLHGALAAASPPASGWTDSTRAAFRAATAREPTVTVQASWAGRAPGGFLQSVPGTLATFVLMSTVLHAAVLLSSERSTGTLRRIACEAVPLRWLVTGQIISRTFVSWVQVAILLAGARIIYNFDPGPGLGAFLLVAAVYTLTCVGLGHLAGAIFTTPQAAAMASWISCMLMAAIGGAWWSLEFVPSAMRKAAHIFPTAWAMDGFHAVTTYGGSYADVLVPVIVLLAMAGAAAVAAGLMLRPAR
jgi:ABC-2 type transport system permease protein